MIRRPVQIGGKKSRCAGLAEWRRDLLALFFALLLILRPREMQTTSPVRNSMAPAAQRKRPKSSNSREEPPAAIPSRVSKSRKPRGGRPLAAGQLQRSRGASPTPSAASDSAVLSASAGSRPATPSPSLDAEPDFVLAEVTHTATPTGASEPAIAPSLLQRILHHHFKDKDGTRITTDAKEAVGKYVETFVREAIMRSAHESQAAADDGGRDDGFLEVADLEKMAVQLVLDF